MPYGVGIDLGTSFTSAAVLAPDGTKMVALSPDVVTPSVAYATPGGGLLTGDAAEQAARGGEANRVARGFKRRLGDPTPLVLGGAAYSPAALMAAQLRDVLGRVSTLLGEPPSTVVLTCPAIWGPYRQEHFAEVPRLAGVPASRLITEPEAAATHYSVERRLGDGEVVAVYDLGGGTFDSTILRMRAHGMEILGTPEGIEHLGGVDFDETLLAHVDERLGGAIGTLDRSDPAQARALADIRAVCVRAKEELSTEPDVELTVPLPSGPRQLLVTRLQFNEMIRPAVRLTTDGLRRTIASAGLRPEELSAILLAGGSSRIPLVEQLVRDEFGTPVRAALHPKFTVALGAAAVSSRPATASASRGLAVGTNAETAEIPRTVSVTPRTGRGRRRRWQVPTVAAALVVVAAVIGTLVATNEPSPSPGLDVAAGSTSTSDSPAPSLAPPVGGTATTSKKTAAVALPTLWVFDGGPVAPFHSLIASTDNWAGIDFGEGGASQHPISAMPDEAGDLRVRWAGGSPGQIYLQNIADARDLTSYVDNGGALVFDTVVHTPPAARTTVAVHCIYPCAAEVEATALFRGLPTEQKTTLRIPLSCFVDKGLDAEMVNTPFLVYTAGVFDATFSDVRWEAHVSDATPCKDLT
ncbi:Hsp70 family protein [Actinophytocola oryzae]|uniref:Hsp70 protein n=1 Tax=Actinophytocola oryzae TaxID=502181 RepID=A0A4R7V627_9PSEU|nr:Hsp70 family protein [Actinophytocola oryzae]TDV44938.1 Hsp70 protein [Actinophytocola oryzae]